MESIHSSSPVVHPSLLQASPAGGDETYRFGFHGEGGPYFFLLLKNVLLTIITLGIYAAWAKTARRKFIWSNVEIHGQRLVYTGTGREMFIAYLKLAALYVLMVGVTALAGQISPAAQTMVQGMLAIPLLILVPYAIYWSHAYLRSRTQWRGIRFGLTPGAGPFASTFIGGYLLSLITLGIYSPFWLNNLRRILTNSTRLGTEHFRYDGVGKEVFWITFKGVLLSLITFGIYLFWMQAALQRYYFQHTTLHRARGQFDITGGTLLLLFLINLFGTTLTLGLAYPWISVYTARTILERMSFRGQIDFARIIQHAAEIGPHGDVLAEALDVGIGI